MYILNKKAEREKKHTRIHDWCYMLKKKIGRFKSIMKPRILLIIDIENGQNRERERDLTS